MPSKIMVAQDKFRKNQKVKFTLGRGGTYTGKVIGFEEDGYLTVAYNGKRAATEKTTFTRRIHPMNATAVRS